VKELVLKGGYDKVISSSSAFGKDLVPRIGGLLDVQPITDVTQILVIVLMLKSNRMEEISSLDLSMQVMQ
jgi:hypothetical protein